MLISVGGCYTYKPKQKMGQGDRLCNDSFVMRGWTYVREAPFQFTVKKLEHALLLLLLCRHSMVGKSTSSFTMLIFYYYYYYIWVN